MTTAEAQRRRESRMNRYPFSCFLRFLAAIAEKTKLSTRSDAEFAEAGISSKAAKAQTKENSVSLRLCGEISFN